jgi:hypothetical protein
VAFTVRSYYYQRILYSTTRALYTIFTVAGIVASYSYSEYNTSTSTVLSPLGVLFLLSTHLLVIDAVYKHKKVH